MTKVTNEQFGQLQRRLNDLSRRVDQGTLPFGPTMKILQDLIEGKGINVVEKHIIDCAADPYVPDGWKVEDHKKGGQLEWNPSQIKLHLEKSQQKHNVINGHDLRKELANKPVLNANVLDYLFQHRELIPDSWKGKYVLFWGTIYYRSSDGSLCVRCLYWDDVEWDWHCGWLDRSFDNINPAVLLCK